MVLFTISWAVQQVQQLLDGAVRGRGSGQQDPLMVEPDEAGAADGSCTVRPVDAGAKEILGIRKRQEDRPAVISGDVKKITAPGLPAVTAAAGDIDGIAVVAFRRLKKMGDGFIADA